MIAGMRNRSRDLVRPTGVALALVLFVSSCSGADDGTASTSTIDLGGAGSATTTTVAPTTTRDTTTTTTRVTTTTTTTTASVELTEDQIALALYLADVSEISADLVDSSSGVTDPTFGAEPFERALASLAALMPPPVAEEFHALFLDVYGQFAEATRTFAEVAATGDEVAIQAAALELLETIGSVGTDLDAEQVRLVALAFSFRPDRPEAEYFAKTIEEREELLPLIEEMFAALGSIETDPVGLLATELRLIQELDDIADRMEEVDPPPLFASVHRRQIDLTREMSEVFVDLLATLERGEEPPLTLLIRLQLLGAESATLNADWSRAMAEALRALVG